MRAQVEATLDGRPSSPLGPVALAPPSVAPSSQPVVRRGRIHKVVALAHRYGYQVTMIVAGLLYAIWPGDLIPDDGLYGHVDDAAIVTILAFLAGRVTKRTPSLRELPDAAFRTVRRRARFNG